MRLTATARVALGQARTRLRLDDAAAAKRIVDELLLADFLARLTRSRRLDPGDRFACFKLGCDGVSYRECVRRQKATDAQRTRQASRGQGTKQPTCDTRTCVQGQTIRNALAPDVGEWHGCGPGGRYARFADRSSEAQVNATKRRLRRVGLLDPVRSMDEPPDEAA